MRSNMSLNLVSVVIIIVLGFRGLCFTMVEATER